MIAVEVKNLTTQFGQQIIHSDLSVSIQSQEIFGIVGGSGTGKSVLLNYMIGLKTPTKGTIAFHAPYSQLNIGVLFQSGALISALTVEENIRLPMEKIAKIPKDIAREIAYLKLKMVGLNENDGLKYPAALSGGMIKRVGIARALALEAPLLFLDEPTAGLDPISSEKFDQLILDLQHSLGLTVVLVTHDLDTIGTICDRVGVLIDKKMICGPLDEITENPHPWIQDYFHGNRGKHIFSKRHKVH